MIKRILFLEKEWREKCPSVNLEEQLGWAEYWLNTNSKGAHYTDMTRFLSSWFKRCQKDLEKAQANTGPIQMPRSAYKEPKPDGEVMGPEDFAKMREAIRRPNA